MNLKPNDMKYNYNWAYFSTSTKDLGMFVNSLDLQQFLVVHFELNGGQEKNVSTVGILL